MRTDQYLMIMVATVAALHIVGGDTPKAAGPQAKPSVIAAREPARTVTRKANRSLRRRIATLRPVRDRPEPAQPLVARTAIVKPPTPTAAPTPTARPTVTLQHAQLLSKLARDGVRNAQITYHGDRIEFAGRKSVAFLAIPFRMSGRFERSGAALAFRITTFTISGSPASSSLRDAIQAKLEKLLPAPVGQGGQIIIQESGRDVYRQDF